MNDLYDNNRTDDELENEEVMKAYGLDSHDKLLSDSKYNLAIGMILLWGFFVNYLIVNFMPLSFYEKVDPIVLLIGYFVLCLAGSMMSKISKNPVISFIGYNLVVLPMGTVLNLFLLEFEAAIIIRSVVITGVVVLLMMILGATFPRFFMSIGRALGVSLLITIIVELLSIFFFPTMGVYIDYFVILIFCGYIGFDWGMANALPKTLDNAVDVAANIYVDIINLFIRILRASSRRSN